MPAKARARWLTERAFRDMASEAKQAGAEP